MYFVYYSNYDERGIEEFATEAEAAAFIEKRLAASGHRANTDCYTVIRGNKMTITPVTTATRVRLSL